MAKTKTWHSAFNRRALSRPMRIGLESGIIHRKISLFDYGCGFGGDVSRLRKNGITANGYDPYYFPRNQLIYSDIVTCLFVIDVIPDEDMRYAVLKKCWLLSRDHLIVAARMDGTARSLGVKSGDGMAKQRTFQRGWTQPQFRDFVETCLHQRTTLLHDGFVILSKLESPLLFRGSVNKRLPT